MHVSQLSRAAARQCRKRPQPELEQAVSDIYPRLIRTEAGDPHETPAQRPPRRSRETPLLSRPGPDYRPRKSALMVKTVQISPQARAANVERFGRYRRTLEPGLNFVVP